TRDPNEDRKEPCVGRPRTPTPREVFSELAEVWPSLERGRGERIHQAARRVTTALRDGGSVLDIGCGTGSLLARVRAEARRAGKPIGATIGVDLADGMVERACRRRGVRALPGSAEDL